MAHLINVPDTHKQKTLTALFKKLWALDKASINIDFTEVKIKKEKRPQIIFSETATRKIKNLITKCDKEIGFQGFVTKNKNTYTVDDIIVYPQTVTGVTVRTDDKDILEWQLKQDVNKIRFQGHSHVNMGVTPSMDDENTYKNLFEATDNFYIVLIGNKKEQYFIRLYDKQKNMIFEKEDLQITFNDPVEQWAETEIKTNLKTHTVIQTKYKPQQTTADWDMFYDEQGSEYKWI